MDTSVPAVEAAVAGTLASMDGVVSACLFGSVAEGRDHRESDVDLGVLLARGAHPTARARFDVRLRLVGRLQAAQPGVGRGARDPIQQPADRHTAPIAPTPPSALSS